MNVMGSLVIFASEDGGNGPEGWKPLRPEEVPEWVRHPDVLGTMVKGAMAHDPRGADTRWFRAQRVADTTVRVANEEDARDRVLAIRSPVAMKPHLPIVILPGEVDL